MSDTRFSRKRIGLGLLLLAAVLGLLVTTTQVSVAQTLTTLYSFEGGVNGKQYPYDGAYPYGGLLRWGRNMYGTTIFGGNYGQGTVFEVTPEDTDSILYSFKGGSDGANPVSTLIRDTAGNLYGTTDNGGTYNSGTVFKLIPPVTHRDGWTEQLLYTFTGGTDGGNPGAGALIEDALGNLYGETLGGGLYGYGTVYEITGVNNETVLYNFTGGSDGAYPVGGLVEDRHGNLYGMTEACVSNGGSVFKISLSGPTETTLYTFPPGNPCANNGYSLSVV